MDALIGKNNIYISDTVLSEMCNTISKYPRETGGIIGVNTSGEIIAFQFDQQSNLDLYEYHPDVNFLNEVINKKWAEKDIKFVGFVHSHMHNDALSQQDLVYAKEILNANEFLSDITLGIINLNSEKIRVKWYKVEKESVLQLCEYIVRGV